MDDPPMPPLPDLPDEDTLILPSGWRRQVHPRRGGPYPVTIGEPAREGVIARESAADVRAVFNARGTDPDLAEQALAHLNGAASPVGAAAVAAATGFAYGDLAAEWAMDAWVDDHGLAFAVCAFAELATIVPTGWQDEGTGVTRRSSGQFHYEMLHAGAARRFRARLAVAGEQEYEESVARLAHCRRTPVQRAVVSYLVPDRRDWADECAGTVPGALEWMMCCSISEPYQIDLLADDLSLGWGWKPTTLSIVATVLDGLGPAAVPLVVRFLDDARDAETRKLLLEALALLPTDEAFQILIERLDQKYVQPVLLGAAKRFPVRALRLLAEAAAAGTRRAAHAAGLLRAHVLKNSELTAAVLAELPESIRTAVESIGMGGARIPDAPAELLPSSLVTPPWTRRRAVARPVVIEGLTAPAERSLVWANGEREAWAVAPDRWWRLRDADWPATIQRFRTGQLRGSAEAGVLTDGPEELVRPLLATWEPDHLWDAQEWIRPLLARFELDAVPLVFRVAATSPAATGGVLLPVLDTKAASLAARWLTRLKSARAHALAWFDRHGVRAVPLLLPAALGRTGAGRRDAETALRYIASKQGTAEVVAAVRPHAPDDAVRAIETLLATDPLETLPARVPKIGNWADPAVLPQVLLRDRAHALPVEATGHLLTMLAMSRLDDVYAGVAVVRDLCAAGALAEFAWAVFQGWRAAGEPAKDGWALTQLGLLGDDETVRRLTPVIRAWPGEGGHAKAVTGLDVLAAIGTDVALMHLHGVAQKVKFKGLKTRAQAKIAEVAAGLELTPDQLADRLVPDFGLDANGGLTLDYGPRRFVAGFDERLKPYVSDENGKRRTSLPKPGVKDDPELAPAAYKRFAALKKDVRTVAADQIRRLETAMVTGRRWSVPDFRRYFVGHPLLWHITRRLVWIAEDGGKTTAFRIAEDRTLADVDDDVLTLPESARAGIVHPLHLGEALAAWSEVFADYEILQPFPQLGRAVHRLTDEERTSGRLERFENITVPVGRVLGLERRGWQRGEPQDAGVECWISRQVAADRHVLIALDPGIPVGAVTELGEQTLRRVLLVDRPDDYWRRDRSHRLFGELGPATASEVLADLTDLAEAAN